MKEYNRLEGEREKFSFTNREREVVHLLCEGLTSKEIANSLSLSVYTVVSHKKNLIEKTGAKNTVHMVVRALRSPNIVNV